MILFSFLFIGTVAAAQTNGAERGLPAPPPDRQTPLSDRISWIVANPDHVAAVDVFSDVIADVDTIDDLERIRLEVLPALADPGVLREATGELAAIYRTARQYETSANLYRQAYELSLSSDLESLFAHAQILFELGDNSAANAESRVIVQRTSDYSLKRRAYTLSARISFETGNTNQALEMLETLASLGSADNYGAELVEVETLVLLRQIYELADAPADAGRIDALLLRLFPDSVAAGIVNEESRLLSLPGLPSALLLSDIGSVMQMPEGQTEDSLAQAPGLSRDQPRLSAIQVGSFGDAENAEHLTADLQRLGLSARSEAVSREGATLHQVMVSIPGGTTESAARVLSTLREHGFDGFLVY